MATLFLILYNLLFTILLVPSLIVLLLLSGKYRKEIFYKVFERFCAWKYEAGRNSKKTVWIHCSSLGEVRAVEPVIDRLKLQYNIVLTAITKTGREYAQKTGKADFVALFPLDLYPFISKAFNIIKPDMLVLVETELWASLLYAAAAKKVKIVTVNGRMSEKSFRIYNALGFFWKYFAGFINIILARSPEDAARFEILTRGKTRICISGNIKYDRDFGVSVSRSSFGLSEKERVFTAGSIREGEAAIIADAYIKIREKMPDTVFFTAPRHLSKISSVKRALKDKNIDYLLFSEMLAGKREGQKFILVDVFGKLQSIYAVSDICFVGGSLVNKGGQNPIEPAASAKAVFFGKHMDNFKTEADILLKYGGAVTVSGAADISQKAQELLSDEELLSAAGANALKAVNSQKGAVNITVNTIKEQLN